MKCNCGTGFRFHAINCPTNPNEVLNRVLDERCKREAREWAAFRRWVSKSGNGTLAAQILVGTADPSDPFVAKVAARRAELFGEGANE